MSNVKSFEQSTLVFLVESRNVESHKVESHKVESKIAMSMLIQNKNSIKLITNH